MERHRIFGAAWYAVNVLLGGALILLLFSATWEYSTRKYLKGFADAIVPANADPIEKAAAILHWMADGPSRQADAGAHNGGNRDPEWTLNYSSLLRVCGTATNAFVNVANAGGVPARRLLLFGPNRTTNHVVAEIFTGSRWVVVDPSFRIIPRGPDGQPLTREELRNPVTFRSAVQGLPNYDPSYNYERTSHLRVARVPVVGAALRSLLDHFVPGWGDSVYITLLAERRSFLLTVAALFSLLFLLAARAVLRRVGKVRWGIEPSRFRERFWRAYQTFLHEPS